MVYNGKPYWILKWMICRYHHFRKHPYVRIYIYISIINVDAHIFIFLSSMVGHLLQPKVGTSTNSDFCAVMDCTTTLRIQRLEGSLLWNQPKQNYHKFATSLFPLKMGTLHIAPWEKEDQRKSSTQTKFWKGYVSPWKMGPIYRHWTIPLQQLRIHLSHENNFFTFHYTGCLVGILITVYERIPT